MLGIARFSKNGSMEPYDGLHGFEVVAFDYGLPGYLVGSDDGGTMPLRRM